ncbi:sensor histidine kinase [Amnibacterium endophyticum]|uniref:Sensor histidine kinase n=1 Tax=Amnibacterium endophyticum TaxID=2109337 RepID=A0ABW4LA29_9MICO
MTAAAPAAGSARLVARRRGRGRGRGERAEERIRRALAFGFLPAGVVFGALAEQEAANQASHFPAWWMLVAFALGVGPSILLGIAALVAPVAALTRIAGVAVWCVLVVQASVPLVVLPWPEANGQAWFLQVGGLGLIAAALAFRPKAAVLTQVLGAAEVTVTRAATDHSDAFVQGLQDGLYLLLFTLTFVALGIGAIGAARVADEEEAEAIASAATAAADAAREREQARVNALVHDRVLATLLAAARPVPGSSDLQRADAARALAGLRALLHDESPREDTTGRELIWQVQAVTTELAPEAGFGHDLDGDPDVPGEVAEALLQATEEALRNSLRHAGTANRTVHVAVEPTGIRIDVLDDGVGFERATVPAERLGIAESIEGRLRSLPGGAADVVTEPGVGTRVLLRWASP